MQPSGNTRSPRSSGSGRRRPSRWGFSPGWSPPGSGTSSGAASDWLRPLLILLTLGLIWQFVLVLILIRHELGGLQWSRVRDALWLRPPRDPKTGRVGGRVW